MIRAENLNPANSNITFTLCEGNYKNDVTVSMPGDYMVMNALGSIAIAEHYGATIDDIKAGLSEVKIFGRSEIVPNKLGLKIMIDYAHTPASLESILSTVKPYTQGRVICVYVCV